SIARVVGLQGGWDPSNPRRLSAMRSAGHTSTLDLGKSSCSISRCWASGFEQRALRYQAGLEIAPERHQELARQRHDRNAPDPPLQDAHPFANQMLKALSGW